MNRPAISVLTTDDGTCVVAHDELAFIFPFVIRRLGLEVDDSKAAPYTISDYLDINKAKNVVVVSSAEIYGDYIQADEESHICTDNVYYQIEQSVADICKPTSTPICILRCAPIVGTGMTGITRRLANGIYRGRIVKIPGNEATMPLIHAIDVANAIADTAGTAGTYNLSDNIDHNIHDVLDALAWRIQNKRIAVVKRFWARIYMGSQLYRLLTVTRHLDSTKILPLLSVAPMNVTQYLTTHEYSQQDI